MSDELVDRVSDTDLEAQLCALEHLDLQGLREVWRRRWGAAPKLRSADLLRLQAHVQGGLGPDIRARLRSKFSPWRNTAQAEKFLRGRPDASGPS